MLCYVIYRFNVYRGNLRDGCYFHQQNNNKRMKENEDRDFVNGSTLKSRFKNFLNFSYVKEFICFFYKFLIFLGCRQGHPMTSGFLSNDFKRCFRPSGVLVKMFICSVILGELEYSRINHKNYNFLDCDWLKKTSIFH